MIQSHEEIVKRHLRNRPLTPVKFRNEKGVSYGAPINKLLSITDKKARILYIFSINSNYPTYSHRNNYQCYAGARRSAQDIYRIYINYFNDIKDIFEIMRLLYQLAFIDRDLSCHYCDTVRKYVFWRAPVYGSTISDPNSTNDLGVPFSHWENIGIEK